MSDSLYLKWRRVRWTLMCLALLATIAGMAMCMSGCVDEKQTRSEHRTTTETWQGSVTIPAPAPAADGRWAVVPTPVPFSLTKTTEENSDGTTHTQTGIDPAAVAQIGGALAGALKTAFPAIGAIGAAADSGMDLIKALLGGTTVIGGGLAALKHVSASRKQREADDAWDEASDAKARAAAAEARVDVLEHKAKA